MFRIWLWLALLCSLPAGTCIPWWARIQHFTDIPPPAATSLRIGTGREPLHRVRMVIDGDTFELLDGRRVRLIGINAPEVSHHTRAGEPGGEAAAEFLKKALQGKRIRLLPGAEPLDKYDRLLAHAFTEDGINVNGRLLERGLVHASVHPPNTRLAFDYMRLEQEARRARRGIWKLGRYRVKPARRANELRRRFQRIKGNVSTVRVSGKYIRLLLDGKLVVYVARSDAADFVNSGLQLTRLTGRSITVRGWLHTRHGEPALQLRHSAQIEAVQ